MEKPIQTEFTVSAYKDNTQMNIKEIYCENMNGN
jgi:hypothetical protein